MTYGLPTGTNITYGSPGFPAWVYELAGRFNLKASTYPGHQEGQRAEKGFAPNPQRLNRGIDWVGSVADMQRFADFLLTVRTDLEQVIWENPNNTGQRVGVAGGDNVTHTAYYAADWAGHRDHVHLRTSKPIPLPGGATVTATNRPDFNEYPIWSPNGGSRNGYNPDLFLLHTEEGGSTKNGADRLARWMQNPSSRVSYHYTVSMDEHDKGVTVVDVRDTDLTSWSALSANPRSINLVFAGSKAAWTREEWLRWANRAIDVAAYLAAQDCAKYPSIPKRVIKPPYGPPGGITDHRYVTRYLKDGTHTDVGGPMGPPWTGFPWDVFEAAFLKYTGQKPAPTPAPTPPKPDVAASIKQTEWERIWRTHIEWLAFTYGDMKAVAELVAAARAGDTSAMRAVARLEQVNPAALQNYIATTKG